MEEVGGVRHVNCCDVTAEYGQCNRWSPGVGAGPTWTPHHINNLVAVFILGSECLTYLIWARPNVSSQPILIYYYTP